MHGHFRDHVLHLMPAGALSSQPLYMAIEPRLDGTRNGKLAMSIWSTYVEDTCAPLKEHFIAAQQRRCIMQIYS